MRAPALATALIAAAAITLTGCGGGDGGTSAAGGDGTAAAAEEEPGTAGGAADGAPESLRFSGTTVEGKPFEGAKLAGKPTVLWFWAPWCGTCKGQAAQTAKLADEYKGEVNVVGVAGLDKTGPMKEFISSSKVGNFPHVADEPGAIWKKFEVTRQSTYVMLDEEGRTVHNDTPSGPAELESRIAELAG